MPKGNPKGNLAGFTDRAVPGWEADALARIGLRQKKTKRHAERKSGVLAVYDPPFQTYFDEAAHRRGTSLAGYARRALAAFVAYDLGIPIEEVAKHMPRPTEYRAGGGVGRMERTEDDGTGFGPWIITEVTDAGESA